MKGFSSSCHNEMVATKAAVEPEVSKHKCILFLAFCFPTVLQDRVGAEFNFSQHWRVHCNNKQWTQIQ